MSSLHGVVFLSALHAAAAIGGFYSDGSLMWAPWPSRVGVVHLALRHIHYAVIAYLLKDFVILESHLDWGFIIHHFGSVIGCCFCLTFPAYSGLITINVVQCEFASGIYSTSHLLPTWRVLRYFHWMLMSTSNLCVAYIAWLVYGAEALANWQKQGFVLLSVLLGILRCGNVVLELIAASKPHDPSKKD